MSDPLVLGAVAYDAKVVSIWDGFKAYFEASGLPFDFVLYSNYERQVEALAAGHVHVAWNSPLAWIQTQRLAQRAGRCARAIAMRDTDRDLTSVVVVSESSAIRTIADLRGRSVGTGAGDSPQATLIPLVHIAEHGVEPSRDFEVVRFDRLLGKHGDHIGGERDAIKALLVGDVDAACIIASNHLQFIRDGVLPSGATRVLAQTGTFDHCNFSVFDGERSDQVERFLALLLEMSYEDPQVRPLLDLEGLTAWMPGRLQGYELLERAVDRFHYLDGWLAVR